MHALRMAFLCLLALTAQAETPAPLPGYSPDAARVERKWEGRFRAMPSPTALRESLQHLAARPHQLGSAADKANAQWILARFRSWGLDARIETFQVLFPTPRERAVELLEPARFTASLREPPVGGDPSSRQQAEQLPTYNAYSADGDVTARLVYVNHGIPEDYEQLERLGVSVKGAIVIARYGGSWRGIKPKVAAEHGAVGCLIYSDPRDDGYFAGDVFPRGPWRPREGVQRGSVMDMPLYPGDPLTPGVGATTEAKRLALKDVPTLTRIPVLPLSYGDAQPLLAGLGGPVAPEAWRGALPITYHVGPGPAKVHLKLRSNWGMATAYDVIATIPGARYPDEWVLRGNHHDAWVNGAQDPTAGQAALLEEARGLAALVKVGWKPARTILFCAWDGEEEGLLGSTEWAEAHAEELRQHAVAYINSDMNGRGTLNAAGSHTLEPFINGVARDIPDPEKGISVWKRLQLQRIRRAANAEERQEARRRPDLRIGALGSGSDYSVFLDHLGIASLDLSYGGEDEGGIYHSIYDDPTWYTQFGDPDFAYGRALAQTAGTAVMRLADAEILPFDFTALSDTIGKYVEELQKLLKSRQDEVRERNQEIEEGVFTATADPTKPFVPPPVEPVPPYLNFAPLQNAADALARSAQRYAAELAKFRESGRPKPASLHALNQMLIQSERKLTDPAGLPERPWYQHQIYAPGFYTGYGVKTIPAVREAIEQKQWKLVDEQIARVGRLLEGEAELIDAAAGELEKMAR